MRQALRDLGQELSKAMEQAQRLARQAADDVSRLVGDPPLQRRRQARARTRPTELIREIAPPPRRGPHHRGGVPGQEGRAPRAAVSDPEAWARLVEGLRPHVSPEWVPPAPRSTAARAWIRLILLVDAHHQLSSPRVAEKVAMTMADLAVGHEREAERDGLGGGAAHGPGAAAWSSSPGSSTPPPTLLPEDLQPLFARSIEPSPPGM